MKRSRKTAGGGFTGCVESFVSCRALVTRFLVRFVKPQEIEDIVQEAFVRSYVAARAREIDNPEAFLLKTAKHVALDYLKRAERRLNLSIDDLTEADLPVQAESAESTHESREQFLIFCEAVARLPLRCRRVFILKKVYGLSHKEISSYLGITESTIDQHISNGMAVTAEHMADNGYLVRASLSRAVRRQQRGSKG